jgi:hypothetical protein
MRSKAVLTATPPAPPVYRSEGQRLLCEHATAAGVIARELGVIKQVVSNWRVGANIPSDTQRERLAELYAIPVASWERVPRGALPPVTEERTSRKQVRLEPEPDDNASGGEPSVLDDCLTQLAWLRAQMKRDDILAREKLQLNDAFRKALRDKARYQLDAENSENRMVRNHPAWQRFRSRLLAILRRHPEAAREVADLITDLFGEEHGR